MSTSLDDSSLEPATTTDERLGYHMDVGRRGCVAIIAPVTATSGGSCGGYMSDGSRTVDLRQVPPVPWSWVDEHVYAAIRGCSVRVLQNERRLNIGCPFRRVNGTTVRYRMGDITVFMESQPGGGGSLTPDSLPQRRVGRPRRSTP